MGTGHSTARRETPDGTQDIKKLFRKGECIEDLQLQDLYLGLVEDDRLQFDAFAQAISTGKDREWMQETMLGTCVVMEACNESARTHERVDVQALHAKLLGEL